jgi:hypothetical protein
MMFAYRTARTAAFALLLGLAATTVAAQDRAFQFGLMGDLPYSRIEEQELDRIIAQMNAKELAFVTISRHAERSVLTNAIQRVGDALHQRNE